MAKKLKIGDIVAQGDVLLRKIKSIPKGAKATPDEVKGGKVTLALGEATGHCHVIEPVVDTKVAEKPTDIKAYEKNGNMYLKIDGPAIVTHQEHGTLNLDKGNYERILQYEYDQWQERRVAD